MSPSLEEAAHIWVRDVHPHPVHLERTLDWLLELDPTAGASLRIAALLHDIERAYPDPRSPYDSARDWSETAYVRYHQTRCAQYLAGWLLDREADPVIARDAVELVLYHEEGGWPQADMLQAADSLSFIENLTPLIRDWIAEARTTPEGALAKLEHMYERMQVPRARVLGRPLIEAALVECRPGVTDWLQPATLDEALALRRAHGDDALVIAGGTFVGILLSTGLLAPPPAFLALRDVAGLDAVREEGGTLVLGAVATHRQVETDPRVLAGWPALAACLRLVANERVRNQATIGGVLADADYASDPPALLAVLGAEAVLAGPGGRRAVPVSELIVDHYTTVLEPDELLVEVRVPPQPGVALYRKFRSRHAEDRPCVGVALAAGRDAAGRLHGLRVAVGAVSGRPVELPEACALAEGAAIEPSLAEEIGRRYAAGIDPLDDARGSAAYRRRIIAVEVRRALLETA